MPKASQSNTQLIQTIEAEHGCTGRDLSGLDFERISSDDELTFTDCKITGARIKGDALMASHWKNCLFRDCIFAMADLREVEFTNCGFYNSTEVSGSQFQHCTLNRAVFTDCDLTLSKFKGCEAYDIAFTDCQMRGTNFEGTSFAMAMGRQHLNAAKFQDCRLTDALLDKLNLASCQFIDCDMTGIALTGTRLVNATIKDCAFVAPEMIGADLSGADLSGSSLEGMRLTDLRAYAAMTVSASQQHFLLHSLGIEVNPD